GILNVTAKDKATGKENKIRIEASTGLSDAEIDRMKREAAENADTDTKRKEEAEKLNGADQLIFSTEKQLTELGDKLSDTHKTAINDSMAELKEAHAAKDFDRIDAATAALNQAWQNASQEIYAAQQEGQAAPNGAGAGPEAEASAEAGEENVTDVEYEEVDEK
ncbi:MAG: Hsp70 family protein, partial [Bacteroidota bacterium]